MAAIHTDCDHGSVPLRDYVSAIDGTDILGSNSLEPVLLGLYGEVGGIMSAAKKHVREGAAFPGFRKAAEEEFGDTLWYFAALCRRVGHSLEDVFTRASQATSYKLVGAASDYSQGAMAHVILPKESVHLDLALFDLGRAAAALLGTSPAEENLIKFARHYLEALNGSQLNFSTIVRGNIRKTRGAFLPPDPSSLSDFDCLSCYLSAN